MTTKAIILIIKTYVSACGINHGDIIYDDLVYRSHADQLRKQADEEEKCESATNKLLELTHEEGEAIIVNSKLNTISVTPTKSSK